MIKRIINKAIDFGNQMNNNSVPAYAASVSFFFFLSLFPIMMFIFSLLPYLPITEADFIKVVFDLVPESLQGTIVNVIGEIYNASAKVLPITAVATLWTAGSGMMGLIRGLNGLLNLEDKRNYFVLRGVAVLYTLLMLTVITVSYIIVLFGEPIVRGFIGEFPQIKGILMVLLKLRGLLIWILLVVILILAYTFLPAKKQKLVFQIPGALLASTGWCIVTVFFTIYIDKFNGFSMYGSMTTIMVALLWMYALFTLVMFGAYFNKYFKPYFKVGYYQQKRINEIKKERLEELENRESSID